MGVFFQNFLKKFFVNKKPPISLVIEVNRRRVEIFIILVYNRKLRSFNYETLINIYYARKDHKLAEWHTFCDWIKTLPYAQEIIIAEGK